MAAAVMSSSSVLTTFGAVQGALAAGRGELALQVQEYTSQLTATFSALRRKHFPWVPIT
jgi:hypothetical protein